MDPSKITRPNIDPRLEEMLGQLSIYWDPNAEPIHGRIRWQRMPIDNGDGWGFSFTTRESLPFDEYTMIWVMDEIYAAGQRDGRKDLREALKQLIAQDDSR